MVYIKSHKPIGSLLFKPQIQNCEE